VAVGRWVTSEAEGIAAFYDIDTPVTLGKLARHDYEYISPELIAKYDLYLSFTGGPTLQLLENRYGSPRARPLYCSVDPDYYRPLDLPAVWDLGYLGTYSADRQPTLNRLLIEAARQRPEGKFVVAGPQYPAEIPWPQNVERIEHVPPGEHAEFYNRQRYTLNVTRADMIRAGYSPSVRLFEAAACGTPIISDAWPGLDEFFEPGKDLLVASNAEETASYLHAFSEEQRQAIGQHARHRVLARHTSAHRAAELECYVEEMVSMKT
jgi:spore maturation protein CgeB